MPFQPASDRPADPDPDGLTLHSVLVVILVVAGFGLLMCMGMGAAGEKFWVLDLFNHFYVQYAFIAALGVVAGLALRTRTAVAVFALALGIAAMRIVPLLRSVNPPGLQNPAELKLVALNVKTANLDYQRTIEWLLAENADVLVVQETGQRWVDEIHSIMRAYKRLDTNTIRDDNFGISIFVKERVEVTRIESLGSPATVPWIEIQIQDEDRSLRLLAVHTLPPMGPSASASRDVHLAAVAERVKSGSRPVVVAGDLNATIWSKGLAGLLESTRLRPATFGRGLGGSWPASLWFTGMILIDHVLVSETVDVRSYRVGQDVGSDHRGIVVDLAYE